jgi:hypothetical protein
MERHLFRTIFIACLSLAGAAPCLALTPLAPPALQVNGDDFPDLIVHTPVFDAAGNQQSLACDQIRAKRIDELDPLWKRAVERIHLDCETLSKEDAGFDMVATVITAFLKPGAARFAGVPVAEVRLMDSDLWSDHQYVLDRPYAEIREALKQHVEARCRAQQDNPSFLVNRDCKASAIEQSLYLATSEAGGAWMHAEAENPGRTIYAETWAD